RRKSARSIRSGLTVHQRMPGTAGLGDTTARRTEGRSFRTGYELALLKTLFTRGTWERGIVPRHSQPYRGAQVQVHRNAETSPKSRALLVQRVRELSWSMQRAFTASGVSVRTGYNWWPRYRAEGPRASRVGPARRSPAPGDSLGSKSRYLACARDCSAA